MELNVLDMDKDLFRAINGTTHPFLDSVMATLSNLLLWLPIFITIIYLAAKIFKSEKASYQGLNVFLFVVFSSLIVIFGFWVLPTIFDTYLQRVRPCHDPSLSPVIRILEGDCTQEFAFFAYRPCVSFSLAAFWFFAFNSNSKVNRRIKIALIIWALMVSYSRIYLGMHYPLNVLFSIVVGIVLGYLVYNLYSYVKRSVLVI